MNRINQSFNTLAEWTARNTGSPVTFFGALALVILWALTGPFFGFSATWQLVINTGTTIATFLMVFLLQNSQNRTTAELHELVRKQNENTSELKSIVRRMAVDNRRLLAKLESIEEDIEELVEDELDETPSPTL